MRIVFFAVAYSLNLSIYMIIYKYITPNLRRFIKVRILYQYAGGAISHFKTDISQNTNTIITTANISFRNLVSSAFIMQASLSTYFSAKGTRAQVRK